MYCVSSIKEKRPTINSFYIQIQNLRYSYKVILAITKIFKCIVLWAFCL